MSDTAQYPNTTGFRRINPTLANTKVLKFKPTSGYEEIEKLKDEVGVPFLYNGVNLEHEYDIELCPLAGFTEPKQLTKLTFVAPTEAGALPFAGAANDGNIYVLIISKVESAQDETGKVGKYSFKAVTNANFPSSTT